MRSGLSIRLRDVTVEAHRQLEAAMPPLVTRPSAENFRSVLQRFYGFHKVWENDLDRHAELAQLFEGRGRLTHIESDLSALGVTSGHLERLPRCLGAAELTFDAETALGSLYVMEGSTLGGQIISHAIAAAEWAPTAGLSYFNPYGSKTGLMWRALLAALDEAPEAHYDRITAGALRTFAVLRDWMRGAPSSSLSGNRHDDPLRAPVSGR